MYGTNGGTVRRFATRSMLAGAGVVLLQVCGAIGQVWAQDSSAAGATTEGAVIDEIIITATRRSESLSRVPISVTALSQDAMDIRGIKDIQDIVRFTPGVAVDYTGTNAISIRGISSSGGAGTTGIYLDDTPIQMRSLGFNPDDSLPKTFDLDRVEILRGPQGTLFGAGSEGGTVRYIMTPASLTESSTYLRTELSFTQGGQPSYELGVAHGAVLKEGTFGIRASAWFRQDGGWIDRVDPTTRVKTESDANHAATAMFRLAAIWRPAAAWTITPSVVYQNSNKHDESTYWPAYSNPGAGKFNNATPERLPVPDQYVLPAIKLEVNLAHSQIISNTSYYYRKEKTGYQGTVYNLSYYQSLGWPSNPNTGGLGCGVTSMATGPPCDWYPLIDGNGIHLPAGFADYQSPDTITNNQQSWTQEVRWQSTDDASRWRWTVGAFWQLSKERSVDDLKDAHIVDLFQYLYDVTPYDVFVQGPPDYSPGFWYTCKGQLLPTEGPYTAIPECDVYYNNTATTDRQLAAFGEVGYALTDQWRLTLGDRVARTSFTLDNYADGLENYGPTSAHASQSETPNTPKVNIAYQRNAANLFYATYAEGFRVGGGNAPLPSYCDPDLKTAGFPDGAPLTYQSDSTRSYELGAKNSVGPAFKVATSVYYIQWHNIQQSVYIGGGCGLQFTSNLGEAVAKGFDLQAEFAAGPWKFDLATGYTDARYTEPTKQIVPPLASAGDAISGQASINYSPGLAPPWTVAAGAELAFHLAENPAFVRFDYQYQARNNWLSTLQDQSTSQYNPETYALPSTVFAQLRSGVTIQDWEVAAFVDNLFDTHAVTSYQLGQPDAYNPTPPTSQQNQYTFRPRTFGLTLACHL